MNEYMAEVEARLSEPVDVEVVCGALLDALADCGAAIRATGDSIISAIFTIGGHEVSGDVCRRACDHFWQELSAILPQYVTMQITKLSVEEYEGDFDDLRGEI